MKKISAFSALFVCIFVTCTTSVFAERDLETGVFLSRDPAGFVDGPNVYSYVKQNPWTAFDPRGLTTSYINEYTQKLVNNVRAADPRVASKRITPGERERVRCWRIVASK